MDYHDERIAATQRVIQQSQGVVTTARAAIAPPARLDQLMTDARARRIDVVVCRRLNRFGRNLRQLVNATSASTRAHITLGCVLN